MANPDKALPRIAELELARTSDENASAQPAAPALMGLHAKLYVLDYGREASVFTGSAKATHAAFNRNVEFLTELRGKKGILGVAAVLGEATDPAEKKPGAASLADLLRPFKPGDGAAVEESTEDKFERLVDEIAKRLARAELSAECQEASDGSGAKLGHQF